MSKIYGYCRVSTARQSIERQIRNIKGEYKTALIYQEAKTGTNFDRAEWQKLMKIIKPGDTIVFDSVSRMSREAAEGFEVYEQLFKMGVNLVFLKEPHINTAVYKDALEQGVPMTGGNVDVILQGVNQYLFLLAKEQIRIAFDQAEKEVQDLHQRVAEGIETARQNGKQIGRKTGTKIITEKERSMKTLMQAKLKSFGGYLTDAEFIKMNNISKPTFYKYKAELLG